MPSALRRDDGHYFSQLAKVLWQIRVGDSEAAGAGVGLGTGALIGDRVQALEKKQSDLDQQVKQNELELQHERAELEKLKKQNKER